MVGMDKSKPAASHYSLCLEISRSDSRILAHYFGERACLRINCTSEERCNEGNKQGSVKNRNVAESKNWGGESENVEPWRKIIEKYQYFSHNPQ